MKIEKVHRTPLVRQVSEGVEIARCKADVVMNSKGEWNGSKLPRMVIERGDKVELDEDDINIRMMNWEERKRDTSEILRTDRTVCKKRKDREEDFSDCNEEVTYSDKNEKINEVEVIQKTEKRKNKKLRLDTRDKKGDPAQVPQVR